MTADPASRVFVVGSSGQLARALVAVPGSRATSAGRNSIDLSRPELIRECLDGLWRTDSPSCVINAAAFTEVDRAETEISLANAINAIAPFELARWCKSREIPFVHFSTDYVYDGDGTEPRIEAASAGPLNAYGRSKLDGDEAIERVGGDFMIFRTSWVYDSKGKNFLKTILRLGAEREELSIVADQCGAPTYAPHVAAATFAAIAHASAAPVFPRGVYHLCARGETSWHGFATEALAMATRLGMPVRVRRVREITSAEYPTPAKRPLNSRLDTSKAERELGLVLPDWRQGVAECLAELASTAEAPGRV